jgi:hypothetical protein
MSLFMLNKNKPEEWCLLAVFVPAQACCGQCASLIHGTQACVIYMKSNDTLVVAVLQVSHAIRDALMVRAADFGIVLEDIAITHLSFGTEFTKAVEMKQVAEQDAERARFVVLKAEQVGVCCL